MEQAAREVSAPRRTDITLLKGMCIIGVLLIHAQPLIGAPVHDRLINRAVFVFLVLFGLTSELWWQKRGLDPARRTLLAWYRSRAARLLVPLWGTLAVWWAFVIAYRPPVSLKPTLIVASALGYVPALGTSWFVTVVLQLIVLFPALRWIALRLGGPLALLGSGVVMLASYRSMFAILEWVRLLLRNSTPTGGFNGLYAFWIFAPTYFFLVVAGILIGRHLARLRILGVVSAAALGITLALAPRTEFLRSLWLTAAMDAPLTVLLLLAMHPLTSLAPLRRVLAWLGERSWGIYLGQMLIHDGLHAIHVAPETAAVPYRWAYFCFLLAGAAALTVAGERLRAVLRADQPATLVHP